MDKCFASYDFSKLKDILDIPKNKVLKLFKDSDDFCKNFSRIKKEYDLEDASNFNIFSSISKVYRYENLHSDIIRLMLDPSTTEEVGSAENVKLFIALLNRIKPELKIELNDEKIEVEREKKRIDILVHDESSAIIIENKINGAKDQDNQIGKYYEEVSKKKPDKVKAVVYLTLTPDKKPEMEVSITNPKMREEIRPKLIHVPVINPKNKELSFSDGFIKKCIEHIGEAKEKELARVYYTQYNKLIQSIGGDSMKMPYMQGALEEIYGDKDKLAAFKMFGDLWAQKEEILPGIMEKLLEKEGFEKYPDGGDWTMYREINSVVSLAYDSGHAFGFVITPGAKLADFKKKHKDLIDCFRNKKLKNIFFEESPLEDAEDWVYKYVDISKIDDVKDIISNFKVLEKSLGNV